MFGYSSKTKPLALLLLAASVLIALSHVWRPITISSPDASERTGFFVAMTISAVFVGYGYRWARISIGVLFVFFASINSLILLAYFPTMSLKQIGEIALITLILGATGSLFLWWKGVRVFEEKRKEQKLVGF